MELPKFINNGKYEEFDVTKFVEKGELSKIPVRDYGGESYLHYHQFIDTCLGNDECTAPFSYSARLTETILLGVIAGNFPGKKLNWDRKNGVFLEKEANYFLKKFKREY